MKTVKVKMLAAMAGKDLLLRAGDEHECTPEEAARWIRRGIAKPIRIRRTKAVIAEDRERAKE
jgi:hypothetical protein